MRSTLTRFARGVAWRVCVWVVAILVITLIRKVLSTY